MMTYTYEPHKIAEYGKDRMRFDLGDTEVCGCGETCVLSDEEYTAIIGDTLHESAQGWKLTKLAVLRAIMFKLSYQPDTKIDVLSYAFGKRAELWRQMYDDLRKEISNQTGGPTMGGFGGIGDAACKPPYFYTGMKENPRTLFGYGVVRSGIHKW